MAINNCSMYGAHASPTKLVVPVKADSVIDEGNLVCLDATGYAVPAATATGLVPVGRAEKSVDATGLASGALTIECRLGAMKFKNSSAADLIAVAQLLTDCYIVNGSTVAKTSASSTRSIAGKVLVIETDGVVVSIGPR